MRTFQLSYGTRIVVRFLLKSNIYCHLTKYRQFAGMERHTVEFITQRNQY